MRPVAARSIVKLTLARLAILLFLAAGSAAAAEPCAATAKPGDDVQAAIDALAAQPGAAVLCLDAGEFALDGFLAIERDGLSLRGQGPETVLRLSEGRESPVIVVGDHRREAPRRTIRDVTIEHMRIIGGGAGGSETHPHHAYLRNSAVAVRKGEGIVIRGLDVSRCRSACILTEHGSREVTIEGNTVSEAAWDGISLNRASHTRVVGNTLRNNVAAGLTTEFLEHSRIENNRFIDNGSHGAYLADAYDNVFRENLFQGNAGAGVYLTCSIRFRDPVLCWDNSMSRGNLFERNEYRSNGFGYLLGVDTAANCKSADRGPNLSRDELFHDSRNSEPDWETYGRCLEYQGSRTE